MTQLCISEVRRLDHDNSIKLILELSLLIKFRDWWFI